MKKINIKKRNKKMWRRDKRRNRRRNTLGTKNWRTRERFLLWMQHNRNYRMRIELHKFFLYTWHKRRNKEDSVLSLYGSRSTLARGIFFLIMKCSRFDRFIVPHGQCQWLFIKSRHVTPIILLNFMYTTYSIIAIGLLSRYYQMKWHISRSYITHNI